MTIPGHRLLGALFDGTPIYEPKPAHSLLLSAAGGGKTTCGAMPWLMSHIADYSKAVVITDSKDGELAAQAAAMCAAHGRKVAVLDDFGCLGAEIPFKISLSPLGACLAAHAADDGELVFATENANQALIEEPKDDAKNAYFRDWPRSLIEFATLALMKRSTRLATPGGIWAMLANQRSMMQAAMIEVEEGDAVLKALAADILSMKGHEHFPQHRSAALKSLRIFSAGSKLHQAGMDATTTHAELIREKYVIFLVGPQRHMARLGPYYALHLLSFNEALLSGAGPVAFILDEFTNAPLKPLIDQLTIMRAYGGTCHMIAQSRSEIQRRFGEKETLTIEENAVVKQWFGFSSFEEAERVSRAMGETLNVSASMGTSSKDVVFSTNLQTGKERLMTPDELMGLPPDEQILHVKGVGWLRCRKIGQHMIAPYAQDLAPNPLEGGRLAPDIRVALHESKRRKK